MTTPEYWAGKTVLLTGATGFLGGWMARRLLELDVELICIVRQERPASQFYTEGFDQQAKIYRGSIDDPELITRIFDEQAIDVVFHCGYGADVNRVMQEPLECFRSSVLSTWQLLETLRISQPGCVTVISSSDKAYGMQEVPFRETQRLNPVHPYEVAKASEDLAAQSYGKMFKLPVAVTRCANYFGGFDLNFTRLIPGTLRSIFRGEAPSLRSDGTFTRDFLYIEDAVDAQLLLAERLGAGDEIRGEAFNFSYGQRIRIIDLVHDLVSDSGTQLTPSVGNQAGNEIRDLSLDSSKAREVLDWKPTVGFEKGLKKTVEWYRAYLPACFGFSIDSSWWSLGMPMLGV